MHQIMLGMCTVSSWKVFCKSSKLMRKKFASVASNYIMVYDKIFKYIVKHAKCLTSSTSISA